MVDEVLTQEILEFEALISLMDNEEQTTDNQEHYMSDYGSDEEYDSLLLETLAEVDHESGTVAAPKAQQDPHLGSQMDLSTG